MRSRRVLTGFVALLAALTAAAGAQGAPLTATTPIETSADNPLATCAADGAGTVFPDSEVEPWVDVNPEDPANIVGGYQQDRYSNGGAKSNVATASFDGGTTWMQTVPQQRTTCSGGPNPIFARASDPWVSISPTTGWVHFMSLVLDPDPPGGGFGDNGMVYNRSKDGGKTWEDPITLRQDLDPRFLNDKNSITADPTDSDFVYAVWDRLEIARGEIRSSEPGRENIFGLGFKGPIWFARTTDGGNFFEPAREIFRTAANNQTIGNQIVVRPNGRLYNFFNYIFNFANPEGGRQFEFNLAFIRSLDKGATWDRKARFVHKMNPMDRFREDGVIDTEDVPCPDQNDQGACPIRTGDLLFDVAVDRTTGRLYAVWQDARFDGFEHDSIAFSQSTNGGFSAPIKVNLTPTNLPTDSQQAFTPSVHVADNGRVTVTYYDFRHNTAGDGILATDQWAVHCDPGENCASAAAWDEETRVTPAPFDMRQAPFARGYFVGDYEGLASAGNDFISLFSQSHGTNPSDPSSAFSSRLHP